MKHFLLHGMQADHVAFGIIDDGNESMLADGHFFAEMS
jgi:hypothetical protein